MIGRREFTVAGLTAAALAAWQGSAVAQAPANRSRAAEGHAHGHMEKCAKACSDCQRECDACATHCADQLEAGKKDHAKTLATCLDCATVCAAASTLAARNGPYAVLLCKTCAEVCALCAKECEKFPDDKHMKECAEECRKCEKECKEMVAHAAHS